MRRRTLLLAVALFLLKTTTLAALEREVSVAKGEALRITDVGQGPPIVLVPGLLGSAFGFRQLLPPLVASGHRVLVIEPLGIGGSAKPVSADYSLTAQADRIDAVLAELSVERAVVVAHAVGASMAYRLAVRHPRRVQAIVSLDGGPAEAAATPGFRRAMSFAFLIKLFGGMKRIEGMVRSALQERSADPSWVTDDVVRGYMSAGSRDLDATLAGFRGMARAVEPEALAPRLHEVRCPVRLLIGTATREGGIREPELALLKQRLPDLLIEQVPAAGHFAFEEQPQVVTAAILRAARS
jgi:pimeloyl-ACP methyl ester carboxylesterase